MERYWRWAILRSRDLHGVSQVAPRTGQKTGWFYDQRDNCARLDRHVESRRVLDVFSYVGAWGIRAAARGAREVLCVDSSAAALEQAEANAALNGVSDRV
jgi:23S rRNA (cytosine1962-C5)-methyltransferase